MLSKLRSLVKQRNANVMFKVISKILKNENITFVDVGAAGEVQTRWKQILPKVDFVGFEPDVRSTVNEQLLNKAHSYKIIHEALWDKTGTLKINLCQKPQVSSFFEPNLSLVEQFPNPERFKITGSIDVSVKTLDSLNLIQADFIKIDVQGGEYHVLKGASKTLEKTFALELEVEFAEIYKNQPLFGDAVQFLRGQNFEFLDFTHISRWERKRYAQIGQVIFGDALFIKSPEYILKSADEGDVRRYCAILAIFIRTDLIEVILDKLRQRDPYKKELIEDLSCLLGQSRKQLKKIERFHFFAERILSLLGNTYSNHTIY